MELVHQNFKGRKDRNILVNKPNLPENRRFLRKKIIIHKARTNFKISEKSVIFAGMIHPNTELKYINDTVGYGVFATKLIPAGTITYVKDSLEIVVKPDEYDNHPPEVQELIEKYSYMDQEGDRIISWDFAKYVNHCCNCNSISTGFGFEIAIRDIQPGEQLTDEYGIFNLDEDFSLVCDEPHCRKRVSPTDLDVFYAVWDEKIKQAFTSFGQVPQPLLSLVDLSTRADLDAYLLDPMKYKSVYELRLKKARVRASSNGHAGEDVSVKVG